jgi:nicotinamide/nicotinate riboside kinase
LRSPRGVQSDPEGTLWRDPPHYWENIVYPAYIDANRDVFEGGDVERGKPSGKVERLVLLESLEMSMGDAVSRSCEVIAAFLEAEA